MTNKLRSWSHSDLSKEVTDSLEALARRDDVFQVAAMPDVHLAGGVCVGAVVASEHKLFPAAVGGDIGCGMCAIEFHSSHRRLAKPKNAAKLLQALDTLVPTAFHRSKEACLPSPLEKATLSSPELESKKTKIAGKQFATLGRGNHFVEFQRDEEERLWLMLHSGSRGIGQAIRDYHIEKTDGSGPLRGFDAESAPGRAYLADMNWALSYARQSRRKMVERVASWIEAEFGIEARWSGYLECQHNFARMEEHDGRQLWVHRKGAISARTGEPGIIPGSMGSPSFHVEGRGNVDSLCSSSHGAGRVMSRSEARRRVSRDALFKRMEGVLFDHRLAGRLRDEAPQAYKDIGEVMRAQRELTKITRRLEPFLVYKGT